MKKLNKIRLQDAVVLENSEMKVIYGGSGGSGGSGSKSSGCAGLTREFCGGPCQDDYGYSGSCGWTYAWDSCTCATAYVE